jgi:lipid-binding SYLF domain-containing protein
MFAGISLLLAAAIVGCTSTPAPKSAAMANTLHNEVNAALSEFHAKDPNLQQFLDQSFAYVVFPRVTSGAVGVGGAYGKGEVFQRGQMIGYADLSQANVGAQVGGQNYSELIAFQNQASFDEFRNGQLAFDARASAVAASRGAATAAAYQRGVAIFTNAEGGLMVQAAIGGQTFRYEPNTGMANDRY